MAARAGVPDVRGRRTCGKATRAGGRTCGTRRVVDFGGSAGGRPGSSPDGSTPKTGFDGLREGPLPLRGLRRTRFPAGNGFPSKRGARSWLKSRLMRFGSFGAFGGVSGQFAVGGRSLARRLQWPRGENLYTLPGRPAGYTRVCRSGVAQAVRSTLANGSRGDSPVSPPTGDTEFGTCQPLHALRGVAAAFRRPQLHPNRSVRS